MPASTCVLFRRVEFAETDAAGLVHFSNFFRWMESAEAALFRQEGLPLFARTSDSGVQGWPRVRASCEYKLPLRFGDMVAVCLFVKELKIRSIEYTFRFYKINAEGDAESAAKGTMTTVYASGSLDSSTLASKELSMEILSALTGADPESYRRPDIDSVREAWLSRSNYS